MTTVPRPTAMPATFTCVYDAWNRLAEVRNGANIVAQYRYDGLNRRIRKFQPEGGGAWTVTEYYYNAAWQLLEVHPQGGLSRSGEPLSEPSLAAGLLEQSVGWVACGNPPSLGCCATSTAAILRDRPSPPAGGVGRNARGRVPEGGCSPAGPTGVRRMGPPTRDVMARRHPRRDRQGFRGQR